MKAVIFILGVLFVTNCNAQKFDCSSKINEYKEQFQAKKLNDAFGPWSEAQKNCPKENEALYTDGIQILQYKIDNANKEEKEKTVRSLMKLYDQYNRYFPASLPDFEVYKAMALVNNSIDAKEEIYGLLDSGFTKASLNITDAKALYTYFSLYTERFAAGDKKITSNSVLEKYTAISTLLNQLQFSKPEVKEYKTTQYAIDNLIKDIATCENLADFYSKNYESNKDNADWISSSLISLSGKCSSKPIFLTLAERLYSIKQDAQSANFVALAYVKQRKNGEAIKFYIESAEKQINPLEKAKIYYLLATGLLSNDLPRSKEFLNKALAADPKMGKAYLFLAQMYVNNSKDCAVTDFEKKALFYLASQTVQKAGVVNPALKPTSDKMAADYNSKSLTASEISKGKMDGKSITIGCWINETITFHAK